MFYKIKLIQSKKYETHTQTMAITDIIPTQTHFSDKYVTFYPVLPSFKRNLL